MELNTKFTTKVGRSLWKLKIWWDIFLDFNSITENSPKEAVDRNDVKTTINRILGASTAKELSTREIQDIRSAISKISKWDSLKSSGVQAIPAGDATTAFRRIECTLQKHGIYIVPVGELEGFVKEVGGHGPEWVNRVLESYPDPSADVYTQIRLFISKMNL